MVDPDHQLFQGIVKRPIQKSRLMQQWVQQQGRINHTEMLLNAEREHIKKNREDLEAYKVLITRQVDVAEKAECRVKEHLRNMRQKNTVG